MLMVNQYNVGGGSDLAAGPPTIDANITVDTTQTTAYALAVAAGWDEVTAISLNINLISGSIYHNGASGVGLTVNDDFPAGTVIKISIASGEGIFGGYGTAGPNGGGIGAGGAGGNGGDALVLHRAVIIDNLGEISGGGGGGGGGGSGIAGFLNEEGSECSDASGQGGNGGRGRSFVQAAQGGNSGSTGGGTQQCLVHGGGGGAGGGYGANGNGGNGSTTSGGGCNCNVSMGGSSAGGLGGKSINGVAFATFLNMGTLRGATA